MEPSPFQVAQMTGNRFGETFREQRDTGVIDNVLFQAMQSNNPEELQGAIGKILSQVSPERQPQALEFLKGKYQELRAKSVQDQYRQDQINAGLRPGLKPQENAALLRSQQPAKPVPPSIGEKTILQSEANAYVKAKAELPKLQDAVQNLDRVEELVDNLSGFSGYLKAAVGTKDAAELETLSLTGLDSIFKIFNPVGNLATRKMEFLKDKFSITPWDTSRSSKGKLATMKLMGQQGLERAQRRVNLYEQYNGNPPRELVKQHDEETAQLVDSYKNIAESIDEPKKAEGNKTVKMIGPDGITRDIPMDQVEAAIKANGRLAP